MPNPAPNSWYNEAERALLLDAVGDALNKRNKELLSINVKTAAGERRFMTVRADRDMLMGMERRIKERIGQSA